MTERRLAALAAAYGAGIVLSFGPATVQSERAAAEFKVQCRAERQGDTEGQKWCAVTGPNMTDGLAKAMAWPMWISYTVAKHLAG